MASLEWKRRGSGEGDLKLTPKPMPDLIWRFLSGRGITQLEDIDNFLSPSLNSLSHPFTLKDMDKAVERLVMAHVNQEKICVYGDYDLDGSSGISLLIDGLKKLGFENLSFYQPSRFLEGYGIHGDALETIAARGDRVVISVDCGITAVKEAEVAKSLGLDLIITDHHLARRDEAGEEIIPQCVAVVNPNQKACSSNLTYLSGVGVGFYLLLGIKSVLREVKCDLKSCLDLFAIGTITDMVPLRRENRVLIKHGLKVLSQTQRPGLQALLKRLNLWGRELDSIDVAFSFAPKLNALSRLELAIRPLDVMMCNDTAKAEVLAEEVIGLNEKRKSLQGELEERILSQLKTEQDSPAIVLGSPGHPGVVGLVATKVSQTTNKPAFIVARPQVFL
jgi:single-stranded-DNA-specific exonuclease